MVEISVIIPVYNVEKYLESCLNTIINQTFQDIEIICINDGSKDNSLNILKEFSKKDNRIQVISQKNQGHAVATNKGISMAKGKYLFLMDSDDMLELNALEDTYKLAEEKNVDFVLFKAINYDDENEKYYESKNYNMTELHQKVKENIFNYKDIDDLIFTIPVTPWNKLYKRELINKHNITFPEGLIFDDNVFFWKVLFNSEKIYFHNEFLFKRRWYSSSSTMNGDERFLNSIEIYNLVWDVFKEFNLFEKYKKVLYKNKVSISQFRYNHIRNEYKELFFKEMKKDFLEVFNNEEVYSDFIENIPNLFRQIFFEVLISETHSEFDYLEVKRENINLKNKKNHLTSEKKYLTKINQEIVTSNSWKLTKFLR
ncbi:glycosyltransferase family 2 protein [Methanosphaera sp.]